MTKKTQMYLSILLASFVVLSASLMIRQFVFHTHTGVHHAVICTVILGLSAYLLKFMPRHFFVRAAAGFAVFGMALGLYEVIVLLL